MSGRGINELCFSPVFDNFQVEGETFLRKRDIEIDVIAAFDGAFSGHGAVIAGALGDCFLKQRDGLGVRELGVVEEEIEAGLATHGAEIDDGVFGFAVSEERRHDVFAGVHLGVGEQVARVRLFEAHIERGDVSVDAAEIQAGDEDIVIDVEAGDSIH